MLSDFKHTHCISLPQTVYTHHMCTPCNTSSSRAPTLCSLNVSCSRRRLCMAARVACAVCALCDICSSNDNDACPKCVCARARAHNHLPVDTTQSNRQPVYVTCACQQ